jgi:acetoin utilization protein AcuB
LRVPVSRGSDALKIALLGHERGKSVQIKNWMSKHLVSVEEDTPVVRVSKVMEDHQVRHLPVTRNGRLVGLITDRDLKEALPSRSVSLSAQELYHLLSEVKARDVMQTEPITIRPEQTVEAAAVQMLEHRITAMPVVTREEELLGIISQGDVFRVLIAITGIYQGGVQFAVILEDTPGSIRQVADVIREEKGHIVSILSMTDTVEKGFRKVFLRIKPVPHAALKAIIRKLEQRCTLLYVSQDPLREMVSPSGLPPSPRDG